MFCLYALDPLELKLLMIVSYSVGAEEQNPGPLEKQVFLTSKPSLQPISFSFICRYTEIYL